MDPCNDDIPAEECAFDEKFLSTFEMDDQRRILTEKEGELE